ncbi:MAG: FAD-containing oxidoreductase [Calditrichaceae bacterium]
MKNFDAIIIGTGQSGPPLASRFAKEGMSVAIVERKLFGGTCVNTGCTPTKAMVASAGAAYMARNSDKYGIKIDGSIKVDMQKVIDRKDDIVGRHNDEIPDWMKNMNNLTAFKGHARFESRDTVRIEDELLKADKIFIDAGARARIPDIPGIDKIDYMTNSDIVNISFLPEHLIIIGGSYIGLEFGQMFHRFGSEVTIVEQGSRLIGKEDEDISDGIKQILESEGVKIRLNSNCIGLEQEGKKIKVIMDCQNEKAEITGSHLLIAAGRIPNTDDLGLDKAGVETDHTGYIKTDDKLRTNVQGIWALGDCNGKGAFTHTSYNDYEIVSANLFDNWSRKVSDRIMSYNLYIDPPLGRAGMTAEQVRKSGKSAMIAKYPMSKVSRALEKGETRGFMKVLIEKDSNRILGAVILGVGGDEIIHSIIDIMYAKKPYTVIRDAVHIHPTVSELIPTMLESFEPLD